MFPLAERQNLQHKIVDPDLLERIAKKRSNENEMHSIIKELLVYFVFVWVLMTLTYGNRNVNGWLLRENLRRSFIHEELRGHENFMKVNTDTVKKMYRLVMSVTFISKCMS